MNGARLRLLHLLKEFYESYPEISTVGIDNVPGEGESLDTWQMPAVFVIAAGGGELVKQTSMRAREDCLFDIWGYVRGVEHAVTVPREELLRIVEDGLYSVALTELLKADMVAHGNTGCRLVEHVGPPSMLDEGGDTSYGWFRLPCRGILHYRLGNK